MLVDSIHNLSMLVLGEQQHWIWKQARHTIPQPTARVRPSNDAGVREQLMYRHKLRQSEVRRNPLENGMGIHQSNQGQITKENNNVRRIAFWNWNVGWSAVVPWHNHLRSKKQNTQRGKWLQGQDDHYVSLPRQGL
jgi:hypothetical protein